MTEPGARMNSCTQNGSSARRRLGGEGGFNVIELALVATVMGILLAAAFPSFRGRNDRYRADAAARELSTRMQWARQKAVATRVPRKMVLDAANMTYSFEYQTSDSTWEKEPNAASYTIRGISSFDTEIGGSITADEVLFETRGTIAAEDAPASFQFVTDSSDTATVTIVRTGRVSTQLRSPAN